MQNVAFERLLFGPDSIVRKSWFEKDDLHLDVSAVGVRMGEGAQIRQLDVPEVVLVFRGCSAWQKRTIFGRDVKVEKGQSDLKGSDPALAAMPPLGFVVPAPRTGWNIVARVFECYMPVEDASRLQEEDRMAGRMGVQG
jgi:hypothetical protein